ELVATEARRRVHAPDLRLHPMGDLLECVVSRQVTVAVVDALEPIDIDHEARDGDGTALRARQLLPQTLLQVTPVVPSGEEVSEAGAQQARAVDAVLQAYRGHRAHVRQKVGPVMTREAARLAAAEAEHAGGALLARQRHQRGALEIRAPRKQEVMV